MFKKKILSSEQNTETISQEERVLQKIKLSLDIKFPGQISIVDYFIPALEFNNDNHGNYNKYLAGYLFIQVLNEDVWNEIIDLSRYMTNFKPCFDNISDDDIINLRNRDEKEKKLSFNVGDRVKVVDGVMKGMQGTVLNIKSDDIIELYTKIFGQESILEVNINQIQHE